MPTEQYVHDRIATALPEGSVIEVVDYTGTGDHFRASVESEAFRGLGRVQQHRLIYDALDGDMGDHAVHALSITTRVPEN